VTGSLTGAYAESLFASNMRRSIGTTQLTWVEEATSTTAYPYPVATTSYSAIARFSLDHDSPFDSTYPANGTVIDRSTWLGRTCGTSGTLAAHIAICATEFGADATWGWNRQRITR
jgi:hypothetical protein